MSRREQISEEKTRRIAVGGTVAGVLVIVFLLVIIVVQFVQIGVGNRRRAQLDEEIARFNEQIEKAEKDLDWYETANGLYFTARQYGWR